MTKAEAYTITRENLGPDKNGTIAMNVYVDGSHVGGYVGEIADERIEAKALLFASSPVMLDALKDAEKEIEEMLEDFCQSEGPEEDSSAQATLAIIRAAIVRAEGEA